ncbi:MAG: aminotransferase class I/II-fold pyridoxal phosphate-dependent enzyme [Gammaproteobacteria bacterium]|jgi:2-aminoadipate transaminase|nr:aminotransferase class I/II-fold pyridoxal phosphate-dependent enzyme [Gammaproteobacteria bacterium]
MNQITFDFGSGRADPDTFPTEALQAAAQRAIERNARALTDYPGALGHEGLRRAMARRESEREGVDVNPDHLVLTNGSMQAVTLTAQALQDNPGDSVILEEFSYPGTLAAYRNLRLNMEAIPLSPEGMRLDALEARLEQLASENRQARFIYAISTYQNPTGFVMPGKRRQELIDIARRFGVPVVEDNCYADVHYEGPVEPALYALDEGPDILYTCSLSKILAPGLRLGYVYARPPMLERVTARRNDAGSNTLAAAIAAEFYADGIWDHARRVNPALREKRDRLLETLEAELADICVWSRPPGGLFVWVRLPDDVDRQRLWALSRENGVGYLPGSAFHTAGADAPYLRLAFGHLDLATIETGVRALARCIREARRSNERRTFDDLFEPA